MTHFDLLWFTAISVAIPALILWRLWGKGWPIRTALIMMLITMLIVDLGSIRFY